MTKNKYIKSPLNYVGGKYKLLPQILPLFPDRVNTFVDLFGGGANVSVNVDADKIVYNEIVTELPKLLKYFKENEIDYIEEKIFDLIDSYKLSRTDVNGYSFYNTDSSKGVYSYNKEKFEKLRDDYNNGMNDEISFYALVLFSFNNSIRFNDKGEYNQSCNKRDFNKSLQKNLKLFVKRLKEIKIHFSNNDFRKLKIEKLTTEDFVYLDPPYYITVANYNENGGWTEQDEYDLYELCDKLHSQGVKFALSNVTYHKGKQNDILIEWSSKYNIHNLNHSYGNSNYHTKDKSKEGSQEVLVTNY